MREAERRVLAAKMQEVHLREELLSEKRVCGGVFLWLPLCNAAPGASLSLLGVVLIPVSLSMFGKCMSGDSPLLA